MLIKDELTMARFRAAMKGGLIRILDAEFAIVSINESRGFDGKWIMQVELVEVLPVKMPIIPQPTPLAYP